MKWRCYSLILLLLVCTVACKEKKAPVAGQQKPKDFLPVNDFLKSEINHIDTIPYSFTKYSTEGDRTDSAFISKTEFHKLVDEFTEVDITDKKYIDHYDETSLIDTITRLASFTYLANKAGMKVSRIDVYIDPESQRFKKLYIIRNYTTGDTAVSKQLLWQTSGNFVLITSLTIGDKEITRQEKVVWDDKGE